MRSTIILSLICAMACAGAIAQNYQKEELFMDLQQLLDNKLIQYGVEGASVSVRLKDNSSWTGVAGMRSPTQMVDSTLQWNIGSVRKTYISTLILQLEEAGALSLDDHIGMYLPTDTLVNIDSAISIKSLLNHTSPLSNGWIDSSTFWSEVFANRDSIWTLSQTLQYTPAPVANPSAVHRYQGHINFVLLTLLLESIENKPIDQIVEERITTPLGLQNTTVCVGPYAMTELNGVYASNVSRSQLSHDSYFTSRAAMNVTLQDITAFTRALHKGELLNAATLDKMYDNAVATQNSGPIQCGGTVDVDYGLGLLIPTLSFDSGESMKLYGHSGTGANIGSVFHNPLEDWTVAIFGNEFDNLFVNAMVFDVLCHLHNNPVDWPEEPNSALELKSQEVELRIFPNPTTKAFQVVAEGVLIEEIILTDLSGRKVADISVDFLGMGKAEVAFTKPISVGTYILTLMDQHRSYRQKVIIEN